MTPLEIEVLLHYYSRSTDYRGGDFSAPAVRDAINGYLANGLLEKTNGCPDATPLLRITSAGNRLVKALQQAPLCALVETMNSQREGHQASAHDLQMPSMSLRDYFAAQALSGILACFRDFKESEATTKGRCILAYEYADAMLKARQS